jgi:4-hydroxybenzoate polyprenyltransferase/phosphoserine phosphatase
MNKIPLVVDLDGTLINTDMLHESAIAAFRQNPFVVFKILLWLTRGKAYLKASLAKLITINAETLPYNQVFLTWLKLKKDEGRYIVLSTASHSSYANAISKHLGVFDEVISTEANINLAGKHKSDALVTKYGKQAFDYAGNSHADLHVWENARNAVVVNASSGLIKKTQAKYHVERVFDKKKLSFKSIRQMFRFHQWLKNALLFVPMLAAHQLTDYNTWVSLGIAFVSFSLCASAVYIGNDLLDLSSDRLHPRKSSRPFASGDVPIVVGAILIPILLTISGVLASYLNPDFMFWLALYFILTCAYSLYIKRVVLIDCMTLAVLYTIRIIAGAAAAVMSLSLWLLAFSIFIFFSLAFVKRYAELKAHTLKERDLVHGRGYFTSDAQLVQILGIASGHSALVILALYLNSEAVLSLYSNPKVIWAAIPIMLFWISWVWIKAHRNEMNDDPLVFAVKDPTSLLAGLMLALVLYVGAVGLPWLK